VRHARTTLASLAIVSLLWAAMTSTAAAGGGSISIGDQGADGELGAGFQNFVGWTPFGTCRTGVEIEPQPVEYRFALEFPLASLPADATITGATLAIRTASSDGANQTAINGYAGDGSITTADVQVGGSSVLHTPTTADREDVDVMSLLTPDVVSAGWAGFSLRQQPFVFFENADWDCPTQDLYPILTIEFSVPDPPAPTPTATATATATASPAPAALPNTATPSGGSWSASFAVLAVVAVVGVLTARRRRISR
jgi:hypothetical protein